MRPIVALSSWILLLATMPLNSHAAVVVIAKEIGNDVQFSGSGTINLAAFTTFRDVQLYPGLVPVNSFYPPGLAVGGHTTIPISSDAYGGFFSGPSTFGPGPFRIADLVTGDRFGAGNNNLTREIYVPNGYTSGAMLTGTSTFSSETFWSLGITPGTYVWAWGSGSNADSLTLKIVPEPSVAAMLIAGGALIAARAGANRN